MIWRIVGDAALLSNAFSLSAPLGWAEDRARLGLRKGQRLVRPDSGELAHRASIGRGTAGRRAEGRQRTASRVAAVVWARGLPGGHVAVGLVGLAGLAEGVVEVGPLVGLVFGFEEVADGAEAAGHLVVGQLVQLSHP